MTIVYTFLTLFSDEFGLFFSGHSICIVSVVRRSEPLNFDVTTPVTGDRAIHLHITQFTSVTSAAFGARDSIAADTGAELKGGIVFAGWWGWGLQIEGLFQMVHAGLKGAGRDHLESLAVPLAQIFGLDVVRGRGALEFFPELGLVHLPLAVIGATGRHSPVEALSAPGAVLLAGELVRGHGRELALEQAVVGEEDLVQQGVVLSDERRLGGEEPPVEPRDGSLLRFFVANRHVLVGFEDLGVSVHPAYPRPGDEVVRGVANRVVLGRIEEDVSLAVGVSAR